MLKLRIVLVRTNRHTDPAIIGGLVNSAVVEQWLSEAGDFFVTVLDTNDNEGNGGVSCLLLTIGP